MRWPPERPSHEWLFLDESEKIAPLQVDTEGVEEATVEFVVVDLLLRVEYDAHFEQTDSRGSADFFLPGSAFARGRGWVGASLLGKKLTGCSPVL